LARNQDSVSEWGDMFTLRVKTDLAWNWYNVYE
jgi:hypothetical protein